MVVSSAIRRQSAPHQETVSAIDIIMEMGKSVFLLTLVKQIMETAMWNLASVCMMVQDR